MSTTKETAERTQRGAAVNIVAFSDLAIIDGFNPRTEYRDIEELADSIKENGIVVPLRGHKNKDGKYNITDGHRRYKALEMLDKLGFEIRIPLISDRSDSEEQRLINTIVCNTGQRLNPVEEATVVKRLLNYNYTPKEISMKLGFNIRYVKNLVELANAPKKIQNLITSNVVSATQALSVMRSEKDFESATKIIEEAANIKNNRIAASTSNENNKSSKKSTGAIAAALLLPCFLLNIALAK